MPAISGTVVDATTGRPVSGVDVILRARIGVASFGDGGAENGRYEDFRTGPDGQFRFPAVVETKAAGSLASLDEISLSVNRALISADGTHEVGPTRDWQRSDGNSDVTALAEHLASGEADDPRKSSFAIRAGRPNNSAYFPMSVQFLRNCNSEWNATCLSETPMTPVRIRLIPVLDQPDTCRRISDVESRERCLQLNTYRAALLHVDLVSQVRSGKKLCESLEQSQMAMDCLRQLHRKVMGRKLPPEMDPLGQALILTPIAGLSTESSRLITADLFDETASWMAEYQPLKDRFGSPLLSAVVALCHAQPTAEEITGWMASTGSFPADSETIGVVDGNRIRTVDHNNRSIAAWSSGARIVKLEFRHWVPDDRWAHAVAAAAESWPELIRAYLRNNTPAHCD